MAYIYQSSAERIPDEVQSQLDLQKFYVDNEMNLIASWSGSSEDPFDYYINAEYSLIQGVQ